MKELGNTLAQLLFIIMFMIALAVSTATLSQWASPDTSVGTSADGNRTAVAAGQSETAEPSLSASVAP